MKIAKDNLKIKSALLLTGLMLAVLIAASAVGYVFRALGLPETNIAIVYLLAVLLTARLTDGYTLGVVAALLAAFFFNFLFTEPYFTFSVNTNSYIVTFVIMTITSVVTSALTTHARQNAARASQKEAEAKLLYTLTNRLTDAADIHDIAGIAASTLSTMLNSQVGCLCFDENGLPEQTFLQQVGPEKQVQREMPHTAGLLRRIKNLQTDHMAGPEFYDYLISGRETTLGLLRVPIQTAVKMDSTQNRMMHAVIESTALAMDRFRAREQRLKSMKEIAQERYRGNLLRSISHDLRTPLSGIMGSSEILLNMTEENDGRFPLIEGIHKDANWLHSLVENVLSLTRMQEGKLVLKKEQEAVEEVVDAAIRQVSRYHHEYEIAVEVPDELLLVPMDAKLISQVLVNLLDNAIKHTSPKEEILVRVTKDTENNTAVFSVSDRGEGIAPADLPNVFKMFYTSEVRHSDARFGIGLGLAICESVVKAHEGTIAAYNRTDGKGAEFVFTLPLQEEYDDESI